MTTTQTPGSGYLNLNNAGTINTDASSYGPQASAAQAPAATSPAAVNGALGTSTTPTDYASWISAYDTPTPFVQGAIPDNEVTPTANPSAWGITTEALPLQVITGYPSAQQMSTNQIAATVGDQWHVHPKRGQSMVAALAQTVYDNSPDQGKGTGPKSGTFTDTQAEKYLTQHFGLQSQYDLNDPTQRTQFWSEVAQKSGVNTSANGDPQRMAVSDVLNGVAHSSKGQIEALQEKLIAAGYYPTDAVNKKTVYKTGQMDLATMSAMGHLMTDVARANQYGGNFTWTDYLDQSAEHPSAAVASVTGGKVTLATPEQLRQPMQMAFETALGRAPTSAELASFTSAYNTTRQGAADTNAGSGIGASPFTDQYGVQQQIGAPTEGQAAYDYAQQSDPSGAFAHKFANATGIFANIIASTGGSQAAQDVGMLVRPNIENAGGITSSSL